MDYIKNNDIAVCCLQETGNFLVDNRFVRSRGYAIIDAPCKHRGVAIIVRSVLFDRIVCPAIGKSFVRSIGRTFH